jgi:hypothetical protein
VWGSLARDVLAVMASSVSSERSFSSAAETITKRRNRLKSDIVEALQGLKSAHSNKSRLAHIGQTLEAELELERDQQDLEDELADDDSTIQSPIGSCTSFNPITVDSDTEC